MADKFENRVVGLSDPARNAAAITTGDTALDPLPRSVFVGDGGDLTFRAVDSDSDVTVAVSTGSVFPVRCQYIRSSSTASSLVALW